MRAATRALAIAAVLLGCSRPGPAAVNAEQGDPAARPEPAPAPPPQPPSDWQRACAARLDAAREPASATNREFRVAKLETERLGSGAEQVKLYMFPPVWDTAGFHLVVTRHPGDAPGDDAEWRRFAEVLEGGYHSTIVRTAGAIEASIAFDGWQPPEVDALEPILTAAVDGCFE